MQVMPQVSRRCHRKKTKTLKKFLVRQTEGAITDLALPGVSLPLLDTWRQCFHLSLVREGWWPLHLHRLKSTKWQRNESKRLGGDRTQDPPPPTLTHCIRNLNWVTRVYLCLFTVYGNNTSSQTLKNKIIIIKKRISEANIRPCFSASPRPSLFLR